MTGRTLYVRADNAGDVILQGPAIRAVAAGSDETILWCGPRGREAAGLMPGVDGVVCAALPWISADGAAADSLALAELVDLARSLEADRAVISTSWHQSPLPMALVLRMAGVPWAGAISDDYPGELLDVRHRVSDDLHEVERALSLAAACGFAPSGDDTALRILRESRRPESAGRRAVVHPGCTSSARAWAPYNWRALTRHLVGEGWEVAVTGSDDERRLTAAVSDQLTDADDLGGRTTLEQLAAVIAGADVLVCANTGAMHIAAAVGTPVVCLFAPLVPAVRWRPWQVPSTLLSTAESCPRCTSRRCNVPGHPCVDRVSPARVAEVVEEMAAAAARREAVAV